MRKSLALLKRFAREENGASMVEYAVLVGLITIALVTIVGTMSTGIKNAFQDVVDALPAS